MDRTIISFVLAVAGGLLLLWLVLLVALAVISPGGSTLRESARILPDSIRLVRRLSSDPTLPRSVRVRLLLVLAYLAFPIDLVPDFVPVIGYADDAIVVGLALRSVIRASGPEAVRRHWPGSESGLATLARLCRLPGI